ncbi:membrane protein insertion efficiency factor YidD [Salinarimonas sp. NSM]|uniref:membrane protein insertion efficiency factor YidD n=1 Tax=Salinarimonas sp. NSM TaxID=3458003 RepID=UPI004035123B
MSLRLSRACCGLVHAAAHVPDLPPPLDRAAAAAGIAAIRLYKRHLSRHTGRICLFRPTCSTRALEALETRGWREGICEASRQLARCSGTYTLGIGCDGSAELVTADGRRFTAEEIAPEILPARLSSAR